MFRGGAASDSAISEQAHVVQIQIGDIVRVRGAPNVGGRVVSKESLSQSGEIWLHLIPATSSNIEYGGVEKVPSESVELVERPLRNTDKRSSIPEASMT